MKRNTENIVSKRLEEDTLGNDLCRRPSLENQAIGTGWSKETFPLQIETALVFL